MENKEEREGSWPTMGEPLKRSRCDSYPYTEIDSFRCPISKVPKREDDEVGDGDEDDDEDEEDFEDEEDEDDLDEDEESDEDDIDLSESGPLLDDAVDALLEHSYLENEKVRKNEKPSHIEKTKKVMKKRGQDYFEVLPEGWIEVTHFSGMPLYLHCQSRVCTFSKPYYLGTGSVRKHQVPLSAIPCLHYRKETVTEEKEEANDDTREFKAKVETVQDHKRNKCLNPTEVKEYCEKLFEFDTIKIRKFKTWADRRRYNAMLRELRQRPFLPNDTRLITCSSSNSGSASNSTGKKEFVMNPAGKSFVCILHEFVQHQEKVQPRYIYKELENANTPYSATVVIKNTTYGVGYGNSKRQAKSEAAKKTIEILIPGIRDITDGGTSRSGQVDSSKDLEFFDNIKIEDSRVNELCKKAGQQSPYQILVECLKRNAGTCEGDVRPHFSVELIKPQRNICTMVANEHEAKVICKNKTEGKQRAAQQILQKMHPQVTSWGGLLLMYGRGSCKTPKEKKEQEQKITELQSTASPNKPNYAILNKLKEEMLRLNTD